MTQLPTLCNVQYDVYPETYGMGELVSQWNNSLTMPVRTTVGGGTWLHPCRLASRSVSPNGAKSFCAKNGEYACSQSCRATPQPHRATTSLSRYQTSTESALESTAPYRSQFRAHTTLGRHVAKEDCSRPGSFKLLERKSERRLLVSRQRNADAMLVQKEVVVFGQSHDLNDQKVEEKVIWMDDLRRWISNERPGESSFISFVNTVHMNGRAHLNRTENEDRCDDYLQHFKLKSKASSKQKTQTINRLRAPGLLAVPMKNASSPIIKRLLDARLTESSNDSSSNVRVHFEESAISVEVDSTKELESVTQNEELEKANENDELQPNIETELEIELQDDVEKVEFDTDAEVIATSMSNLDLEDEAETNLLEKESDSQLPSPQPPMSNESSDYERIDSPNTEFYEKKSPPSIPSPPPPLISISSTQNEYTKEARIPVKKVRIEKSVTVHEIPNDSAIRRGPVKVEKQANWIFSDSYQLEEANVKAPIKPIESPLPVSISPALAPTIQSDSEEDYPEESDSRFLELKPRIAKRAGRPRWSSKKRDRSLAEELERQRLAEERRKRSEDLLTRLRQKVFRGNNGADNEDLRYEEYGFLAKYCILNNKSIAVYKAAFDAVDDKRRGWLTPDETLIALRGVNNGLTDAEQKYLSRVLELCGYSMSQGSNFKLFSVISALSQRISSLDLWMKNLMGQMDFKMLDMKFFMCRQLWEFNVDCASNQIPLDQLCIELRAGGVTDAHIREVRQRFGRLRALDLMDFLTYIPLFITLHSSIVANPLNMQQTL